ncbi:hypothetical protein RNJ44_03948 [Nakaseomyces bracarensis]|uniref:Uncharacterized protein n=1 Tax=Nakaseomyces bracarensis TaxID=273131 RepID=A0ABR4NYD3_9SACH
MTLDRPTPAQLNSLRLSDDIAKRQQIVIYSRYLNNLGYYKELQEQELQEPVYTETTEEEEAQEQERARILGRGEPCVTGHGPHTDCRVSNAQSSSEQLIDSDESSHSDMSSNCSSVLSCDVFRTSTENSVYSDTTTESKCTLHPNGIRYRVIDVFLKRP